MLHGTDVPPFGNRLAGDDRAIDDFTLKGI
jgi:hypothetical protein